jgi:hypothetical protein
MSSRRELLKNMGLGFGAAAALLGASAPAAAAATARSSALKALAEGGSDPTPPWWLFSPVRPGSSLGLGWRMGSLSPVERGAVVLELHRDGGDTEGVRVARVHICAREGKARGLAHSELFDLVLMDGGQGEKPTDERLGRVLLGLADRVRKNELESNAELKDLGRLLPHGQRVALYGAETLT